ncbi:MAG: hypothetical protein OEP45_07905 [Acidobacteriota bacterium]|nr:hypothetical protein [Acidobacteriota bacterium]
MTFLPVPRPRFPAGLPAAALLACSFLVIAVVPPAAPAGAQIVVLQNDSVIDFGTAAIQVGFVAGERGAAWLTSPCQADLVAVRILWLDFVNSGTQTLGDTITVSADGPFPAPGAALAELVGPVLTEGFFNEFVVNPAIPIAQDETVVVDFKFLTSPPPLGPSLATDIDGCQQPKNSIFAIPPSAWFDLCPFGVSGDLAIRAVVVCDDSLIFADGFESGDTSAWSDTFPPPLGARLPYPVLRVDPELPPFWRFSAAASGR